MGNLWVYFLLAFICTLILTKFLTSKRFRTWREKKAKSSFFQSQKSQLLQLEKDVKFHLNWAKDRGDSIDLYEEELKQVQKEINDLEKNREVELSDLQGEENLII